MTVIAFPNLAWECHGADLTADAFGPDRRYAGSYRLSPGDIHWQVDFLPPYVGAATEDCGFATTSDTARSIAEEHHRRNWLPSFPRLV
jgi:hypothetical protein